MSDHDSVITPKLSQRDNQYLSLVGSMPARFKTPTLSLASNEMLAYSIDLAREYSGMDKRSLRRLLKKHLREKMDQPRYSSWWMSVLLWWVIPKFIEWFLSRWFDAGMSEEYPA